MSAIDRLLALEDVYDASPAAEGLFLEAMRDVVAWHCERNEAYRNLCALRGFDPGAWDDLAFIPHVFVNAFKAHELLSVPREEVALNLTSSGTSGQKSQIFFDRVSLDRALGMVERVFAAQGMVDRSEEVNYLLFAYDPEEAKNVGTAYTDENLTTFTGRRAVFHALRWSARTGKFEFDLEGAYRKLREYAADGYPTRILGFPAFLNRMVDHHCAMSAPDFDLGPRSFVHTGGGWKASEHEAIDKAEFRAKVGAAFGVPDRNIRDGYGLVEHSVPYIECEEHRFHVPVFARAYSRDVVSLEVLPEGETGFLHLLTPYIRSMPAHSLLTSDLAIVRRGCPCGRQTAWIELRGRAGVKKNKGCAITALEALPA
ncbi:MAG: acyl-protein synthase [Candidatus Sericytochromatia bacterium]|nr:acyl-protein synthase [Candidatus Tanganyikabacteria bacterium]